MNLPAIAVEAGHDGGHRGLTGIRGRDEGPQQGLLPLNQRNRIVAGLNGLCQIRRAGVAPRNTVGAEGFQPSIEARIERRTQVGSSRMEVGQILQRYQAVRQGSRQIGIVGEVQVSQAGEVAQLGRDRTR